MEQLASYIIIITNPYKQAIDQYLKVSKDRYDYLEEFFGEEDNNGRVSFETISNLFFFVTKVRESDCDWKNIFALKMNMSKEQIDKMKQTLTDKPTQIQTPLFSTPTFEKPSPVKPLFDMNQAFDPPEKSDSPF